MCRKRTVKKRRHCGHCTKLTSRGCVCLDRLIDRSAFLDRNLLRSENGDGLPWDDPRLRLTRSGRSARRSHSSRTSYFRTPDGLFGRLTAKADVPLSTPFVTA